MCEKALDFLKRYVKDLMEGTHRIHISYDLWEECEGIHLYSLSSIYSAFESMLGIYQVLGKDVSNFENNRLKDEKISKSKAEVEVLRTSLKKYIQDKMYDEEKKCYVRNPNDKLMDISILGSVVPFNVFTPNEKKIENTIERINMCLRTYTGGYRRYEFDNYNGGNPMAKVQSVEPQIADLANWWLKSYRLDYKLEQESLNTEIDQALNDYVSKSEGTFQGI